MDGIQSIDRAFTILKALAADENRGSRLTDILEAVGLTKSTTHRILQALAQAGAVQQDPRSGLYYLGYDLFCWGVAAGNRLGLVELAQPGMEALAERTGDTVFLSVRDRFESVCVARIEGDFPIRTLTLNVGDRRPLGVGAGSLAILAFLGEDDVRTAVRANFAHRSPYPGFDEPAVYEMIDDVRRRGYAVNDSRIVSGMSALGAPIRDSTGVIAALSVAAVTERMRPPRRDNIVTWLLTQAAEIERRLLPLGRTANLINRIAR